MNRAVMTGEVELDSDYSALEHVNNFYSSASDVWDPLFYESRISTEQGYDNNSFPNLNSNFTVHNVTYYDDYSVLEEAHFNTINGTTYDFSYITGQVGFIENDDDVLSSVKGQVAATKTYLFRLNIYVHTVTYYDWKFRPIQLISTNQFGGLNVVHNLYDFVGNLTHSREVYSMDAGGSEQYVINKEYIYDHADRLLEVYHQIGDDVNNRVLVLQNKYNELGELIEKNLHAANVNEPDNTNYLQSLDYRYNIRGWLQSINTPTTRPDATITHRASRQGVIRVLG
jgi:hypothetical protein